MYKAFKIRLYPNKTQKQTIDQTIGNCRFIYNQMLSERIKIYEELKEDKEKLYSYKYKTEKEYKQEYEFLKLGSSRALQQSRNDLIVAYNNFFKNIKKGKNLGFPKFKSKKNSKFNYREPQLSNNTAIEIKHNKLKLLKVGWIKFRGLSKRFSGKIKSVTISRSKSNKYYASILVEKEKQEIRFRKSNNIIGIDLGLKEFITCSDGIQFTGIQNEIKRIEKEIIKQQKHLSRKILINKKLNIKDSKRREKCRIKLAKLFEYRTNFLNHFQWHLVNKLCSESKAISIESLNISGMIKNKRISHSIQNINWFSFITKLEQKAKQYNTEIYKINQWAPSSKTCSKCGAYKRDLKLSDRIYKCQCGLELDRDINAAINIKKEYLIKNSLEYSENKHGEIVRPRRIIYNPAGYFREVFKDNVNECNVC